MLCVNDCLACRALFSVSAHVAHFDNNLQGRSLLRDALATVSVDHLVTTLVEKRERIGIQQFSHLIELLNG